MRWLVKGAHPGDSLFLYCKYYSGLATVVLTSNIIINLVSGHATTIADPNGDELDGLDECSLFFVFVR